MSQTDKNLKDSTIVITGASSGLGKGVALSLAEIGANVVLAARRTHLLDDLVAEIEKKGGSAIAVTVDVSNLQDVNKLASAAISRYGKIDVWINNVGVGALGLFWDIPVEDHARLIDVNFKGVLFGTHEAIKQFRTQQYGVLINIGSVDSEVPLAYQSIYAATKAAVLSLSRSLNEELSLAGLDKQIKIGTILPWAVDTPWWIHAANYTGHAPRMAAMDDPEKVIQAIVNACLEPKEKQPVGSKAYSSNLSHQLFPGFTEHLSAKIADKEVSKGGAFPHTSGAIYKPLAEGTSVSGGVKKRMEKEDSQE